MNHLKMLGLAVLAAMALVAIAGVGTASAGGGVLCENKNEPCTTTWEVNSHMTFVLKSGTNSRIVSTIGSALRTCTASELTAKVTRAGSATERGKGEVKNEWLTWGGCGAGFGQKTVTPGEIEFEWRSTEAGTKGTVFANNLVITADIGG
ncbi:MAG TPA: hypothetical protein VFM51_04920, partial [Solirubrobacterales bacterium]|nr:hypothetical protein [Solirubrobacterales bacterium]